MKEGEEMQEIPIHCSYTDLIDPTELVPNPRNPNQHPKKQIELLAKIIQSQGWRTSVTVSKRSGFVVRGHGRLMIFTNLPLSPIKMVTKKN